MPFYKRTHFKCGYKQNTLTSSNWCFLLRRECFGPENCEWIYKKLWRFCWEMDCGHCDERWKDIGDCDCFKCKKVEIRDEIKIRWK